MNRIKILLIIGFLIIAIFGFQVAFKPSEQSYGDEPEDLIITLPEEKEYGIIHILDSQGEVKYTYAGKFNIKNDGKNGESVDISLTVPEGGYLDGTDDLPEHVRLYDRSNEEVVDYICSPKIKDETLHLYDASVLDNLDVKERIE